LVKRGGLLGHIISKDGIYIDSKNVEAILKWENRKNIIKIHSFLGLVEYYRRFIERFFYDSNPFNSINLESNKVGMVRRI
jgi:hypothetical protein